MKPVLISIVLMGTALVAVPSVRDADHAARRHPPPPYQLAEVSRGEAVTKVVAAGTVQPVVSVVVGSQVSGQVKEILVDHNDVVKEGQPIAPARSGAFRRPVSRHGRRLTWRTMPCGSPKGGLTAEAAVSTAMAERAKRRRRQNATR